MIMPFWVERVGIMKWAIKQVGVGVLCTCDDVTFAYRLVELLIADARSKADSPAS